MKSLRIISGSALLLLIILGIFVYRPLFREIIAPSFSYEELERLRIENQGLAIEILKLRSTEKSAPPGKFLEARVYSLYPSNERNFFILDKGANNGIALGMPVFADSTGNLLLGKISSVRRFESEVQTLFDVAWKSSVAVGEKKVKALYVGGNSPHLELISHDAELKEGDRIMNINPDFPLDVVLGTVGEVKENSNALWREATIVGAWTPEDVTRVYILTNFP